MSNTVWGRLIKKRFLYLIGQCKYTLILLNANNFCVLFYIAICDFIPDKDNKFLTIQCFQYF
jgi:hypothetical protein